VATLIRPSTSLDEAVCIRSSRRLEPTRVLPATRAERIPFTGPALIEGSHPLAASRGGTLPGAARQLRRSHRQPGTALAGLPRRAPQPGRDRAHRFASVTVQGQSQGGIAGATTCVGADSRSFNPAKARVRRCHLQPRTVARVFRAASANDAHPARDPRVLLS
jgi:hypothetical protein